MLAIFTFFSISLGTYYFILLFEYKRSWNRIEDFTSDQSKLDSFVSIVIVARDEQEKIESCLRSIDANHLPKENFEIIFVDDHSLDNTLQIVEDLNIANLQIIKLSEHLVSDSPINSFKKKAQKIALEKAKGEIILFTDADVIVPEGWINTMMAFLEKKKLSIATGMIRYESDQTLLEEFQSLDIAGTMYMTAAGIQTHKTYLANGANLIVKKDIFYKFTDNRSEDFASGDDVFLIQQIAKDDPSQIGFVKSKTAMVTTYPEESWTSFFNQRLRWATKTRSYPNRRLTFQVSLIYLFNLSIVISLVLGLFAFKGYILLFLLLLSIKITADFVLLYSSKKYFELRVAQNRLAFLSILNIFYLLTIGTTALFKKRYTWKGRLVK